MLEQVGAPDKLGNALHAHALRNIDELIIPGMIEIGQALRCPVIVEKVGKLGVGRGDAACASPALTVFRYYRVAADDIVNKKNGPARAAATGP